MDISRVAGTKVVGYASECDLSYEFHEFVVLYNEEERLYYWSSDSGCSCPAPFEYHEFPDDFSSGNSVEALNALTRWSTGIHVEDDGLRTKLMQARRPAMGTGNAA